ncbi:DUF6241 domain-containing protein [Clostridium estertheticum]|uniref:DUF6241 domain-containing protein n=1 Tax=Clostridium estertheticum TaxID=238834 RepID=UPI0013EEB9CE|nr:DUF6241 domain-containing protein [Clostridium estertheticum]MBZ9609287.1 DUF6241 domain-containing protein [Clostridium estertheticum]
MKQNKVSDKFHAISGKIFPLHGRWLVVSSIALVLAIIGAGSYYITQHKLTETESPKTVQAVQLNKELANKAVEIKANDTVEKISDDELSLYSTMHKMINSKIVAEDGKIWGEIEITPDKCNQLIAKVTKTKYPDKATLLQFLERWKDNNFKSGVDEHNYLWDGLGGTIGKAKDMR